MKYAISLSLLLGILGGNPSIHAISPAECAKELVDEVEEQDALAQLSTAITRWVKKNASVPTKPQLAEQMNLSMSQLRVLFSAAPTSQVRTLLQQIQEGDALESLRKKLATAVSKYVKETYAIPGKKELAEIFALRESDLELVYGPIDTAYEGASAAFAAVRRKLIMEYSRLSKLHKHTISAERLAEHLEMEPAQLAQLTSNRHVFESWETFRTEAAVGKPDYFKQVLDTDIFDQERLDKLEKALLTRSRFILTTAGNDDPLELDSFKSYLTYMRLKDADLIVYAGNMETNELPQELMDTPGVHILTNTVILNSNLRLDRVPIIMKQIYPLSGFDDHGPRGQCAIMGSPKLHVRTVATKDNSLQSHVNFTTGAITLPNYDGERLISGRVDEKADGKHTMGAIILEKYSGKSPYIDLPTYGGFNIRHVEYIPEAKGFFDVDRFYTGKGAKKMTSEAIVLGDSHIGQHDPTLIASLVPLLKKMRTKRIVLHDVLDGYSINPHVVGDYIARADLAERNQLDLAVELKGVVAFINAITAAYPSVDVVLPFSNHPNWLNRYLRDMRFKGDPKNYKLGLELSLNMSKQGDVLEYALKKFGLQHRRRVHVLKANDSYKVGPENRAVQLADHGDKGANGARGSITSQAKATDQSTTGHTHGYSRLNGAVNQGTNTYLTQSYTAGGYSSWVGTVTQIGPYGSQQVFIHQDGQFFRDDNNGPLQRAEDFYPEGYPYIRPLGSEGKGSQIDQYSGRSRN